MSLTSLSESANNPDYLLMALIAMIVTGLCDLGQTKGSTDDNGDERETK